MSYSVSFHTLKIINIIINLVKKSLSLKGIKFHKKVKLTHIAYILERLHYTLKTFITLNFTKKKSTDLTLKIKHVYLKLTLTQFYTFDIFPRRKGGTIPRSVIYLNNQWC